MRRTINTGHVISLSTRSAIVPAQSVARETLSMRAQHDQTRLQFHRRLDENPRRAPGAHPDIWRRGRVSTAAIWPATSNARSHAASPARASARIRSPRPHAAATGARPAPRRAFRRDRARIHSWAACPSHIVSHHTLLLCSSLRPRRMCCADTKNSRCRLHDLFTGREGPRRRERPELL